VTQTKGLLEKYRFVKHDYHMPAVARKPQSRPLLTRITDTDRNLICRAAKAEGRSLAAFILVHSRAAAQRVLEKRDDTIVLSKEQSRRFVAALLAPARRVPPALRAASLDYRKRVVNPL